MLSRYAKSLIQKFHRLAPWIEPQELHQVACLAALEAKRFYRPTMSASWTTYQDTAVRYMLSHCVDRERSAPVNGTLADVRRRTSRVGLEALDPWGDDRDLAADIDIAQAKARLRAILQLAHPAASAVLLHEDKPAAVARRMRMPVAKVYGATLQAKRALKRDEELAQLMAP